MPTLFDRFRVLPAVGVTSLCLAYIALIVGWMPVLGTQLAACGFLLGLAALCLAPLGTRSDLRWALAGFTVSALALTVNVALYCAPLTDVGAGAFASFAQKVRDRPYVPPPAPPNLP